MPMKIGLIWLLFLFLFVYVRDFVVGRDGLKMATIHAVFISTPVHRNTL